MQEQTKWENFSDDEDDIVKPTKPKTPPPEEDLEELKKQVYGNKKNNNNNKPFEKKKLPGKGEMIDNVKKLDTVQVAINIFKLDEKATKDDIYFTFKDVNIQNIYQQQHLKGSFILYFENQEHAIHFIKVAPRPIRDRQFFMMRLGEIRQKFNNAEWNEIGTGGRLVQKLNHNERTGNKFWDKPKRNEKRYNRKEVDDNPFVDEGRVNEQKDESNTYEKKPYQKKPYNKNYQGGYKKDYNREKQNEGEDQKEFKPRFFNSTKGTKAEPKLEKAASQDEEGFQKVKTQAEKKKVVEEPKEKVQEQNDEWTQVGGQTEKKNTEKQERFRKEKEYQKEENRKQNYQQKNKTFNKGVKSEKGTYGQLNE